MESKMKKLSMAKKAKKAGLPAQTVYNRIHNGWSEKKALSVPNGSYKKKSIIGDNTSAPYKVEPKKVQTPKTKGTHNTAVGQKPVIPMEGVEKFEAPKNDNGMYIAIGLVALALMLVVAIAQN
jgi:hypothetical protein